MAAVALLSHAIRHFTAATTAVIRSVGGLVVDGDDGARTTDGGLADVAVLVPGEARRGGDAARRATSMAPRSTGAADRTGSEGGDR